MKCLSCCKSFNPRSGWKRVDQEADGSYTAIYRCPICKSERPKPMSELEIPSMGLLYNPDLDIITTKR